VSRDLARGRAGVDGPAVLGVVAGLLLARYMRQESVSVRLGSGAGCAKQLSAPLTQTFEGALRAAAVAEWDGCEGCDVVVSTEPVSVASEDRVRVWLQSDAGCAGVTVAVRGFSDAQADVLGSCLAEWCASVLDAPDRPMRDLPFGHGDLLNLVAADPPPAQDGQLTPCVRLFEEHASARPDDPALTFGDRTMSYGELDTHASALARQLHDIGVGPGGLVGLTGHPSAAVVIGILAVHKTGAAYVPLDPANPDARLATIVQDGRVGLIVDCGGGWRPAGVRVVTVGASLSELADAPPLKGPARCALDDTAYVLYTSGSTGRPKGVRVTHANVARLFVETRHLLDRDGAEVWTMYHSFAFDFSVWEMWGALARGGRLVVVPYEISRDPIRFVELLTTERVSILSQTPSAFALLSAEVVRRECPPDLSLTHVFFGGEPLDYRSLRAWAARYPLGSPRLVNMYGITETTVHVTEHEVSAEDLESSALTIGRPIRDLRVYLVDDTGTPVPDGATAEMWVAGPGVAGGYLGRPELTCERFVRVGDASQTVLYRSGDLARLDARGRLQFIGRADEQVKVRGYRIELGEIEAVVNDHPGVCGVCVAVEPDRGQSRLVAYVVPAGEAAPSRREMFAFVSTRLPTYMIPQRWVAVPGLPLTVNGKLDRAALARTAEVATSL
jgi:amino acid adenylation domain-containing protein